MKHPAKDIIVSLEWFIMHKIIGVELAMCLKTRRRFAMEHCTSSGDISRVTHLMEDKGAGDTVPR